MTWLVNKTRGVRLTINGIDYSNNLLAINLGDDSAIGNGILTTSGSITLGQIPGGSNIEDYDKNFFSRGRVVLIDVETTSGTFVRHPRGYLYIVDCSYQPEERQLVLDVGCVLYLASLSDNITNLISQTTLTIPEDQRDFNALNSALQAESKILWQDNTGTVQKDDFFETDGAGTNKDPGEWVSILGTTAISVEPLGQGQVIPDKIELTYQRNLTGDSADREDIVETYSYYYLTYPATVWTRQRPENGLDGVDGAGNTSTLPTGRTSDICGDPPLEPPSPGGTETCSEGYTSEPTKAASSVSSYEKIVSYYDGPGGQLSYVEAVKYGPAVELNNQYYADLYAFCVWGYGSACNPSGNCPLTGLERVLQNYSSRTYEYGPGGELIKTTLDEYVNKLSCAIPSDYRSGTRAVSGALEFSAFTAVNTNEFFLGRRTITEFTYFDNGTEQFEQTWLSPCSSSGNPGVRAGCIEATCGLKTSQRRISRSTSAAPEAPDRIGDGTLTKTESYVMEDVRPVTYVTPPDEAATVVAKIQVPYPLSGTKQEAELAARAYLNYIRNLREGDARGLRIAESLRTDILNNWRPGMPYRYVDSPKNKVIALRMNACSWAMDQDECLVSNDGIYIGQSNGSLSDGSNIEGFSGDTLVDPSITGETAVLPPLRLVEVIKVNLQLKAGLETGNSNDGYGVLNPVGNQYIDGFITLTCFVSGGLWQAGSLISSSSGGGVPLSNGNTLLTAGAVAVDADLFS